MNDQPIVKTSPLKQMEQFGQSPWLDFIERKSSPTVACTSCWRRTG